VKDSKVKGREHVDIQTLEFVYTKENHKRKNCGKYLARNFYREKVIEASLWKGSPRGAGGGKEKTFTKNNKFSVKSKKIWRKVNLSTFGDGKEDEKGNASLVQRGIHKKSQNRCTFQK